MRVVIPQPGYTAQDTHDLLATKRFSYVECFTINPIGQSPILLSSGQRKVRVVPIDTPMGLPVAYGDNTLLIQGLKMKGAIGVEVDEQSMQLLFAPTRTYMGLPIAEAIRLGRFDGCVITRDRFFGPDWNTWIGGTRMFQGRFSTVDNVSRSQATFKIKSRLLVLTTQMPKDVYQAGCSWTFGDNGCGIDRSTYEIISTAGASSTRIRVNCAAVLAEHQMGTVNMDDANNFTQVRSIKAVSPGNWFEVVYPFDQEVTTGANLRLYPGCARTYEGPNSCETYNNQDQYRGFPFIPVAETALT